jgi:hypothetical protein
VDSDQLDIHEVTIRKVQHDGLHRKSETGPHALIAEVCPLRGWEKVCEPSGTLFSDE